MSNDDEPMLRARALVERHIAVFGYVPNPDKIKEAIAAELRAGPAATPASDPPLAKLLREVDPGLADVLTDNAAYVQVIRNNVIEECAKKAERLYEKPGWSPHYKNAALAIADIIRKMSTVSRPMLCPAENKGK